MPKPAFVIPKELVPGNMGYICIICEHPLIGAVETSCQHKFCSYCINLWKKHHTLCPICMQDLGMINSRFDVDLLIERFFTTSSSVSQEERCKVIKQRNKMTTLVFGENSSINEMNELIDHLKSPNGQDYVIKTSSKNRNAIKKEIVRYLGETERLERQLHTVYSKILTTGERLTTREDLIVARLCGGGSTGGKQSPLDLAHREFDQLGACLTKADLGVGLGQPNLNNVKKPKYLLEIDVLLELTDDVLQIDKFLKDNSFEVLTQTTIDKSTDENKVNENDDASSIFNDESNRLTTNSMLGENANLLTNSKIPFKIHPEVQNYLDKCNFKIHPLIPKMKQSVETISPPVAVPNQDTIEHDGEEDGGTGNSKREASLDWKTVPTTKGIDLNHKILECRESLLNLKQKSQYEMLQKLNFKPINYFRTHEVQSEEEESSNDYNSSFGPMGDAEDRSNDSSNSLPTHVEQVTPGNHTTIRKIGRQPIRPTIRRQREFTQRCHPHPPTFLQSKEFKIGSTFSLPVIPIREGIAKNVTKSGISTRPQTSIELMNSGMSLRR